MNEIISILKETTMNLHAKIEKITKKANIIGVGTGKTVTSIIPHLPRNKIYVPSSMQTLLQLRSKNLLVTPINALSRIDCYLDSADYIDFDKNLLKGLGGAVVNEKILMKMSKTSYIFVQKHKFVQNFEGKKFVIVAVPEAHLFLKNILEKKGFEIILRMGQNGLKPYITDNGMYVFDVTYKKKHIKKLKSIPGILEHGFICAQNYKYNIIPIGDTDEM